MIIEQPASRINQDVLIHLQDLKETLHLTNIWLGLPNLLLQKLSIPNTLSIPQVLHHLPTEARQKVSLAQQTLSGKGLLVEFDTTNNDNLKTEEQYWVSLSITLEGYNPGVLLLSREKPFEPSELDFLENQGSRNLTISLERAIFRQQIIRFQQILETIHTLCLRSAATQDVKEMLQTFAEATLKYFSSDSVHIYLHQPDVNPESPFAVGVSLSPKGQPTNNILDANFEKLLQFILQRTWPLIIDESNTIPLLAKIGTNQTDFTSLAGYPLLRSGRALGVMIVAYRKRILFSAEDRIALSVIADLASSAAENYRLSRNLTLRQAEVNVLQHIAERVSSTLKLEDVLRNITQEFKELFNANSATIMLLVDNQTLIQAAAVGNSSDLPPKKHFDLFEGLEGRVVMSGQSMVIPDRMLDQRYQPAGKDIRSTIAVPLIIKGKVIGVLSVNSRNPYAFSPDTERLLKIAAAQASSAIENANLYAELEKRYRSLKESERRRLEFIQDITHELHTPLTYLRGYAELLLDGQFGRLNKKQRKSLTIIQEKTNSLVRLVNDVATLEASGSSWLQIQEIDLLKLVHNAKYLIEKSIAEKGLQIDMNLPETLPAIQADYDRIAQVLDNLLGNALKFSEPNGKIIITVSDQTDKALVAIFNEGEAIPKNIHKQIFERFFRGKQHKKGTGLGLAIAKHIITAHNGEIWLKSEENLGNTFCFTLPYQQPSVGINK